MSYQNMQIMFIQRNAYTIYVSLNVTFYALIAPVIVARNKDGRGLGGLLLFYQSPF